MLLVIPKVLHGEALAQVRAALETAAWQDGRASAGRLAVQVKTNQQLAETDPLAQALGARVQSALGANGLFLSAALPNKIYPPRFNRYAGGGHYGVHVDSAIMTPPGQARPGQAPSATALAGQQPLLRSDLSATLFLSEPDDYDGGELTIETAFGAQAVKLPAGDLVLYPSSSLHQVTPVTRGARICSFLWIESLVRDSAAREMLFDLDQSIQALSAAPRPDQQPALLSLTGIYHNLLRRWAQT